LTLEEPMKKSRASNRFRLLRGAVACLIVLLAVVARAEGQNLTSQGEPVMRNTVRAFLIYWLPAGVILDNTVADKTGNFRSLTGQFYSDMSATPYMNIVTQYPGTCEGSSCVLYNLSGAVVLGGSWIDTQAYPHPGIANNSGTQANPLTDADIQAEVTRAIGQNSWTADANSMFFVITGIFSSSGALVEECAGANCTFRGMAFCGYHFSFGSPPTLYSFMSDASFARGGCNEGSNTTVNGQIASDREVALMSHEFMETVTDPQLNAWFVNVNGNINEIGDKCNQIPATITMSGHKYLVQQEWSNASSSCVSSYLVPQALWLDLSFVTKDARNGVPDAASDLSGYVDGQGIQHVFYRGTNNRLNELYTVSGPQDWHWLDLSYVAGAPDAIGELFGYGFEGKVRVVYRGFNSRLNEIWYP
jgi:hypothetical protein